MGYIVNQVGRPGCRFGRVMINDHPTAPVDLGVKREIGNPSLFGKPFEAGPRVGRQRFDLDGQAKFELSESLKETTGHKTVQIALMGEDDFGLR